MTGCLAETEQALGNPAPKEHRENCQESRIGEHQCAATATDVLWECQRCSSCGCQAALAPTSPSPWFKTHSSVEEQLCQGP